MPRSIKENILDKISYYIVDKAVPLLTKLNIHPNVVTLIGFIPIYFIYSNIIMKKRLLVYLFSFINYTLDCLDGELARKTGKTSKLGGFLDSFHDFASLLTIVYIILGIYAIPICLIFGLIVVKVFEMDPITHEAKKHKKFFQFFHDNLNIFYFLTVELIIRYST